MHKVLITGGSGFIGSRLVMELARHDDVALRVALHKRPMPKDALRAAMDGGAEFVARDLCEMYQCQEVMAGIDTVFHCAAVTSGAQVMRDRPLEHVTGNLVMNANLMEAAAAAGVTKFIFLSSCSVYPEHTDLQAECRGLEGKVSYPYRWVGEMKRSAERFGKTYAKDGMLRFAAVRPGNVYGPGMNAGEGAHMIPALIRRVEEGEDPLVVWGSKHVLRDYVYVGDLVAGLALVCDLLDDMAYVTLNIASGKIRAVEEVVDEITWACGKSPQVIYDITKPMTAVALMPDISLAKSLGYWARTDLWDGLKGMVEWYRENGF